MTEADGGVEATAEEVGVDGAAVVAEGARSFAGAEAEIACAVQEVRGGAGLGVFCLGLQRGELLLERAVHRMPPFLVLSPGAAARIVATTRR